MISEFSVFLFISFNDVGLAGIVLTLHTYIKSECG